MATIKFKAKVQTMCNMDDSIAYQYLTVPELKRTHCDMSAFRSHSKFGGLAKSDLFPGILKGIRTQTFKGGVLKLDAIPAGVFVDTSGFLALVSFEV